jgi:hypothetical protein
MIAAPLFTAETTPAMKRYAHIDGEYRYWLERDWWQRDQPRGPVSLIVFVMLNPSTADGLVDDPTIRRCIGFAKREGATSMHVLNLYALRATNPKELLTHPNPVGAGNDECLRGVARYHDRFRTVVAWGANKMVTPERVAVLTDAAKAAGTTLWCLGTTKDGHPRHPLYVRADQPLIPFGPAA